MLKDRGWGLFIPLALAFASIALIIRVNFGNVFGFDMLLLLLGVSLSTLISLSIILRELIQRFHEQSIRHVNQQAMEEHQRFLKRLDHELKNPLTAIRAGLASLLLVVEDENVKKTVHIIESEASRLSRLITNLRKLAEIENIPIEFYPINIAQFVDEITTLHELQLTPSKRHFSIDISDITNHPMLAELVMQGDQDLLLLALHNVVENAFKYTEENATITLSTGVEDGHLIIKIADSGIGIHDEEINYVWDELYRSEAVSHIHGTGIGLALVRNIIEKHNGDVFIDSRLHEGTIVTLVLPMNSA
ncbi:MAG: HAMP domain-containing sensor histidine kinase [Aggregatilineales bacterium]